MKTSRYANDCAIHVSRQTVQSDWSKRVVAKLTSRWCIFSCIAMIASGVAAKVSTIADNGVSVIPPPRLIACRLQVWSMTLRRVANTQSRHRSSRSATPSNRPRLAPWASNLKTLYAVASAPCAGSRSASKRCRASWTKRGKMCSYKTVFASRSRSRSDVNQ